MKTTSNIRLIGLAGKKGAGKDTVAKSISGAQVYAFADELKYIVNRLFNIPLSLLHGSQEDKNRLTHVIDPIEFNRMTVRETLQVFGTDVCRTMSNEVWINSLDKRLKAEADPDKVQIITDVRFTNEIEYIREMGGIVVYLTRDPNKVHVDRHISENTITKDKCDYTLDNANCNLKTQKLGLMKIIDNYWGLNASELEWGELWGGSRNVNG